MRNKKQIESLCRILRLVLRQRSALMEYLNVEFEYLDEKNEFGEQKIIVKEKE